METRPCEQCGEAMPAVSHWGVRQFCGVACRNRAFAERSRRHPKRDCPICHRRMGGPRLTCSAACGYQFRKLRSRKQKTCPICKIQFWPTKRAGMWAKYCSKACCVAKQSERLAMIAVTCEQCARTFRRTKGAVKRSARSFCNRVCSSKYLRGVNAPTYRGGHDPNRGEDWRRLAASIRDRDEHICRRCGKTEAENGRKLDVDHIVPWRAFPGQPEIANDPRNLVSLCMKCHRYKTSVTEAKFLKGDCIAMCQYEEAISLPPLLQHYPGTDR